jgi:hypothetical protein
VQPQRSNERVTIATSRRWVRIPWASRQALLERVKGFTRGKPIVDAFEAVGTSRPVELEPIDKHTLQAVIRFWMEEASLEGLPEGIDDLRNALIDDAHDRGARSCR